ncbi:MAG: esterase-like activity of phytase family protein [Acidobacteriota bacterium]|nr:esterase-like activity of phytase family protein [Acidobacteriota bacterium]
MTRFIHLIFLIALAPPISAQMGFTRGDVLASGSHESIDSQGDPITISNIRVYGRDGVFKRELISQENQFWSEPLYREGIVYAASRVQRIDRIDAAGNLLPPFPAPVVNVNFLSPGPSSGLLAANGSGEIYQLASSGILVHKRDVTQSPRAFGGIELSSDGCTVFYATSGSLARWNACLDTPAAFWGPNLAGASRALRLRPDGTFLVTVINLFPGLGNRVIHVDRDGNLIRSYPIPGYSLALDIDGTSFWTSVGNSLVHVDIDSGEILSLTHTGFHIVGLSVVGEPRAGFAAAVGASIPTASSAMLMMLALTLAALAFIKLR